MKGVDLCSALGAGCRFLVANFKAVMCGVDATAHMIEEARKRAPFDDWGIEFKLASVTAVPYPSGDVRFRLGRGRLVLRHRQGQADRRGGPRS